MRDLGLRAAPSIDLTIVTIWFSLAITDLGRADPLSIDKPGRNLRHQRVALAREGVVDPLIGGECPRSPRRALPG